jgi:hypothetical protein
MAGWQDGRVAALPDANATPKKADEFVHDESLPEVLSNYLIKAIYPCVRKRYSSTQYLILSKFSL